MFSFAVLVAAHFRITGKLSPSRVLASTQNVLIVSALFTFFCLVMGQFQIDLVGKKNVRLITAVVLIFVVLLVLREPIEKQYFLSYGDFEFLTGVVKGPGVFSRWALGSTIISSIYISLTSFITDVGEVKFLSVFSSLLVLSATCIIVLKSKGRLAYLLPLMSPMWIAFVFSYDEYNAYIAPIFLGAALWIFFGEQPKKVQFVSIWAGLLPAIYVGLAPLSVFVLLKLLVPRKDWNERLTSIGIWFMSYIAAIEFSWPAGHIDYLKNLVSDMQLGSSGGFEGKVASENSPFLNVQTIVSEGHLEGVLYMLFFGAGLTAMVLLISIVLSPILLRRSIRSRVLPMLRIGWIQWLFGAWSLAYIVILVAKLGPTGDIDAFYSTYLVLAIVVGLIADRFLNLMDRPAHVRNGLIFAVAAVNGPLIAGLLVFGVQTGCHDYSMVRGWCGV